MRKDGSGQIYGVRSAFEHGEREKMMFLLELAPVIMSLLKIVMQTRGVVESPMAPLGSDLQML